MRGAKLGKEKQPCARTALSVDEMNVLASQITDSADAFWVAPSDDQPVRPEGKIDQQGRVFGHQVLDEWQVVFAGLEIEKMNTRDIGFATGKDEKTCKAAYRGGG